MKTIEAAIKAGQLGLAAGLIEATERGGTQPKRGPKAVRWAQLRAAAGL